MTNADEQPGEGKVDLAVQVAAIAARVTAALRSGNRASRDELQAKLTLARERLAERGAPPGLIPFIDVMRGLLDGRDVVADIVDLPRSYRAVYDQILEDLKRKEGEEGELTVRQVLDQVAHNVTVAMKRGTFDQRRRMADTLQIMEEESRRRPDLEGLVDLLTCARILLKGGDPSAAEAGLFGPFRDTWDEILTALRV